MEETWNGSCCIELKIADVKRLVFHCVGIAGKTGTLEVGKAADITVFDLDEIEMRPEIKTWDVWDGTGGRTYRYTRDPAPMRLTLVNGEPTFDRGEFTGRYPGRFIGPVAAAEAFAIAAE